MNNIFDNAYFGKAYKTRDGRKVLYLSKYECNSSVKGRHIVHRLISEHDGISLVNDDGIYYQDDISSNWDITSEWTINEEELDKLANKSLEESGWGECDNALDSYVDGFKTGCKEIFKRT